MTVISRRPGNTQPSNDVNRVNKLKVFNKNLRYVQGFRSAIAASATTPITITLNSSGKKLLGIALIPASGTLSDIADCQVKFVVNNNNLLLNVAAQNLCPNFVQGMIFFPTPQDLFGNDSITLEITKNNAGAITLLTDIFYVPRI